MAEPTDINDKFELDTYSGTWVDIGEKLLTKDMKAKTLKK